MELHKIDKLFTRYLQNQCSQEEIKILFQYFDAEENESMLKDLIQKELESSEDINIDAGSKAAMEKIFHKIKKAIRKTKY